MLPAGTPARSRMICGSISRQCLVAHPAALGVRPLRADLAQRFGPRAKRHPPEVREDDHTWAGAVPLCAASLRAPRHASRPGRYAVVYGEP